MENEANDDHETLLGRTFDYDPLVLTEYNTVQHSIAHVAVRCRYRPLVPFLSIARNVHNSTRSARRSSTLTNWRPSLPQ